MVDDVSVTFDAETYAKAKPLFLAALKHFQAPGKSLADMAAALLRALKESGLTAEAAQVMRPYFVQFIDDVRPGEIKLGEPEDWRSRKPRPRPKRPRKPPTRRPAHATAASKTETLVDAFWEAFGGRALLRDHRAGAHADAHLRRSAARCLHRPTDADRQDRPRRAAGNAADNRTRQRARHHLHPKGRHFRCGNTPPREIFDDIAVTLLSNARSDGGDRVRVSGSARFQVALRPPMLSARCGAFSLAAFDRITAANRASGYSRRGRTPPPARPRGGGALRRRLRREEIADMNPDERAAEAADALAQGVEPIDETEAARRMAEHVQAPRRSSTCRGCSRRSGRPPAPRPRSAPDTAPLGPVRPRAPTPARGRSARLRTTPYAGRGQRRHGLARPLDDQDRRRPLPVQIQRLGAG